MLYKFILTVYLVFFCTNGFAQEGYHADTLTVNEVKELLAASRNTPFVCYAVADSCSLLGDSTNAGTWLLKVSPYVLMNEYQTPASINAFLNEHFVLPVKARQQYVALFTKTYNQKRSAVFLELKTMAEELATLRQQWELSTTSKDFYKIYNAMQQKDSICFTYLHQYILKNGWPSLANGSVYAAYIAWHDFKHHEQYIPMMRQEIVKGNLPISDLQEMIYWNTWEDRDDYLLKLLRHEGGEFIALDLKSLLEDKMPDSATLVHIEYLANRLHANNLTFVQFCHNAKTHADIMKKPLAEVLDDGRDVYELLTKDLAQYMSLNERTEYAMRLGMWSVYWMPTEHDSVTAKLYLFYDNDTEVAPEANLDKLLTEHKFTTHAINFDVAQSTIQSGSMEFINRLATWLNANPTIKLEIDGHTDSDGDAAANLILSQTRADEVMKQLTLLGINASRLTTKGYGATKPIQANDTPEGKAANRRVEFVKM